MAGPLAADIVNGAFSKPEDGLTLIGFALILGAAWFLPDDVLPALQSTLATAEPQLGNGRPVTGDSTFPYFLPGRVDTLTPAQCRDVRGYRVFVLLTGDESLLAAREAGRLATPVQWASCHSPTLHELSDGSKGYAVFAVDAT